MNYHQYLYFAPRYLNEENLYILNEMYFGKTPRIKALEKLCQLYIDSFKREITDRELESFTKLINNKKILLTKNNNISYNKYEDHYEWLDYKQIQIILLIQNLISMIFGIYYVKIAFNRDFDDYDNMSINHPFLDKSNIKFDNNILYIVDADGHVIEYNKIKNMIIVKNSGISLNMAKCKLKIRLFFSKQMHVEQTAKEIVSSILHEVGHFFSYLILPINKYLFENFIIREKNKYLAYREINKCFKMIEDNKELFNITSDELDKISKLSEKNKENVLKRIAGRVNEKFADQFCSLYGYGPHLSSSFLKNKNIYDNIFGYNKQKEDFTDDINNNSSLKDIETVVTKSNIGYLDIHPVDINRVESQILQLQAELKNPRLSLYKKKQIEEDIQNIRQQLHNYNNNIEEYLQKKIPSDEEILNEIIYDKFTKDIEKNKKFIDDCNSNIEIYKNRIKKYEKEIEKYLQDKEDLFNNEKQLKNKIIEYKKYSLYYNSTDEQIKEDIFKEYDNKINNNIKIINKCKKNIKNENTDIEDAEEVIEQLEKDMDEFLKDKKQIKFEIEKRKRIYELHKQKILFKNKKGIRLLKDKKTNNYMYEKDSYIDPYDISTEINKLYDNTKLRHIDTIFDNNTWLSIKAQKIFTDIFQYCIKTNKIPYDKIIDFIEEKYKYHMEKPFFKCNKIQKEIVKIFMQEKGEIEKELYMLINYNRNLENDIQINKLIKIMEKDNLNANIKQLKRILFAK